MACPVKNLATKKDDSILVNVNGTESGYLTGRCSAAAADAGKKAGDALTKGLSQAGFIGQIVSAILKILDVLKDGIGTLISSLIDTVRTLFKSFCNLACSATLPDFFAFTI